MNYHILIDGNSYLYKAFYGVPKLYNKSGQPTNAIYGFLKMILKVSKKFSPTKLIVVFDGPDNSRQKKILMQDYKIHRQPMPDELKSQTHILCDILSDMDIDMYRLEGVEADDVIAKFINDFINIYNDVSQDMMYVISSDKDLLQYVDGSVKVYNPSDDKIIDEDSVKEKWGVSALQIRDLLALMGDTSDNIPGIPGIGEKTAVKLLQQYHNLQNVLNNASNITGKLGEKITQNKDIALLSYELASPHLDIDVLYKQVKSFKFHISDSVINKLKTLELHAVIKELGIENMPQYDDQLGSLDKNIKYEVLDKFTIQVENDIITNDYKSYLKHNIKNSNNTNKSNNQLTIDFN